MSIRENSGDAQFICMGNAPELIGAIQTEMDEARGF